MGFKNLALNHDKVDEALKMYSDQAFVEGPIKKGGITEYSVKIPSEKAATVHFYFKNDGSTTINPRVGGNQPLSIKIAEFVRDKCSVQETNRGHLYIGGLSEEHFDIMCDFLVEECGATIDAPTEIAHGKQYKAHGKQGDTLSFNYFTNEAFQIQGRPFVLFSETIEILSELLPYSEIVAPQLKMIDAGISEADITEELRQALPTSYDFLGNKVRAIVAPALAYLKINVEMTDYSSIVFPALRGMEGYLKLLFAKHGISITRRVGFGEYFINNPAHLTADAGSHITCQATCQALEKVYNYYKMHRHGLFHTDEVPDTTRIIRQRNEADEIIKTSLSLIEETYTSITA